MQMKMQTAETELNEAFIIRQIRKYNSVKCHLHQDRALTAIGIHAGLLKKKKVALRELTNEERLRVLYFVRQFLVERGMPVVV